MLGVEIKVEANASFADKMERKAKDWLLKVAPDLAQALRNNVGIQGPPTSRPGEFPHKDTSRMHDAIDYEIREDSREIYALVGIIHWSYTVVEFYPAILESTRPWLGPTLKERWPIYVDMLG